MVRKKAAADNGDEQVPEDYEDETSPDKDKPEYSQADLWLGGQGKAQQEAARQAEEDRKAREELERSRKPTGKTKREQEAGEKMLADHQGGGKGAREAKVGKEALKSHEARLPS